MSNVAAGKDTDDEGEKLNDVEKVLEKNNIKLRDSIGQWRNFEDVLDEVAEKWEKFTETQRSQIATAIAGTRQQETFRALMNNYDQVADLADVAANSMGSASEKMEIYTDSVEAKINELKATWEEFVMSLNQSESYKQFLDFLIQLIEHLPQIVSILGTILALTKGKKVLSFLGEFGKDKIDDIRSLINSLKYAKGEIGAFISLVGETKGTATGAKATLSALGKTISGLGMTSKVAAGALGLLVAAIGVGITAYKKYKQAQLDSIDNTAEEAEAIRKEADGIRDIQEEYIKITNSSQSLTEKKQSLASLQTRLNESYDDEKQKVDLVNGSYKEQIELLNQLEKQKIDDEANTYNQNAETRNKALSTGTRNTIYNIDTESKVGKKVLEVAGKYSDLPVTPMTTTKWGFSSTNGNLLPHPETDVTISSNAENLIKMYNELQDAAKDWSQTEQEELGRYLSSNDWLTKSIQEDVETYRNSFDEKQKAIVANFKKDNWAVYSDYQSRLLAMQDLQDKYNNATDKKTKENYANQIVELDNTIKTAKEKLYGLTDDENIKNALNTIFKSLSTYNVPKIDYKSLNVDGVDDDFIENINKEIKDNGELSTETATKIIALEKAMSGENVDTSWLETYRTQLNDVGINLDKVALSQSNLKKEFDDAEKAGLYKDDGGTNEKYDGSLKHQRLVRNNALRALNGYTKDDGTVVEGQYDKVERLRGSGVDTKYIEENIQRLEAEATNAKNNIMGYFSDFFNGIDEQLKKLGINGGDVMISSLKEQLATGEIATVEEFQQKLAEYIKKYGIDIDNLTQKAKTEIGNMNFNFSESVGTDSSFSGLVDKVDDLYKMKATLSGGDFLDYDDFRYLTDNFEDFTDKIVDYGDVTKITANDIQDIIDEVTKKTEEDLNKIEKLFDDTLNNIDDSVKKADFGDEFENVMNDAFNNANESLKQGDKLSFLDNDIVSDTGALTDYATEIDNIATSLETMSISAEDAQGKLYLLALESMDAQSQADALGIIVDLLGTDFFNLDEDVQNALIDLGLYNAETGMADSTQMVATLTNIGNNFDTADAKTQNAYTSLINYIAAIGQAENADPKSTELANMIASDLGEIEAAAGVGARETRVRKAGLRNTNNKGKKKAADKAKSSSSKNSYTPEEAEKDKKSILNDIEDYERDIEADLEDQTEQLVNHYNLERNKLETLREELDYYDAIYDSTENTTKWLETQLDILDEESKKISEMQQSNEKIDAQRKKIYAENKQYNVESWFDSEGNDTLAYGDMLNSFEYKKEAIQKEVAQKMRAEYNRIANSTDKDAIKDAKEKIKLIEEEGDLRIKELEKEKERIENIHDSVETLNDAWDENQEKIRESLQELNDRIKSIRDELIDDLMEQLERATDKMNKSLESNATRLEQLKQVQESYNSLLNDTLDTQDELMDELQANLDSYQYLDEDMRQLMFNEDDYKKLSGVLGDIQEDIAGIWEDHYSQISNLSEDEMYKAQYITAETERQLAAKQKEYDLARAELDIAKAKTNLENVKNERNTRIFANGQWQWVADPTAVRDAQKALADQERAKNKIEREAEQQELIDSLDRLIDSDNLQIDENNDLLEKIQEAIEQETEEVKSIDQALENIKNANLPEINTTLINALGKDGGHMTELLKNINKNQTSLAAALRGQTIEQAEKQLKSGTMDKKAFEELVTRLGYSFNESTGKITTQDGSFDAHYAGWTKKPNNDIQTGTANNGVQVTGGNGGQQQHSPSSTIDSVANKNSQEALKQIAREVWLGKWGNGQDRKNRLTAAGYDYAAVQALVNKGRKYFFDQGGVSTGIGLMPKDTLEPERVLSPRQTKSFDNLVNNLTTNPVLSALSRNPSVVSNLTNMGGTTSSDKNYYFSNFTIQSDDIGQFISSIETMIPMKNN